MPWQLKTYNANPPGNFCFTQTDGVVHRFPPNPVIEQLVKAISAFRIANNLPRGSLAETLEDVDRQQCARLGNSENWCWDSAESFERTHANHPFISASCATCGGTPVK